MATSIATKGNNSSGRGIIMIRIITNWQFVFLTNLYASACATRYTKLFKLQQSSSDYM